MSDMPNIIASLTNRIDRPIALIGLMGSGKSMLGRKLAQKLNLPFADSDTIVEGMAGISIAEIFELAGEPKFRDLERRAILDSVSTGPMVLATGGGAICAEETSRLLDEKTVTVWLQASSKTLLSRIGSTTSRPLLANNDGLATLDRLIAERTPLYQRAHIHLNTNNMSGTAALAALITSLNTHFAVK